MRIGRDWWKRVLTRFNDLKSEKGHPRAWSGIPRESGSEQMITEPYFGTVPAGNLHLEDCTNMKR